MLYACSVTYVWVITIYMLMVLSYNVCIGSTFAEIRLILLLSIMKDLFTIIMDYSSAVGCHVDGDIPVSLCVLLYRKVRHMN